MKDNGILSGVRIVELGQLIAVPYATKLLADMGAEIIRLESANGRMLTGFLPFMMKDGMENIGIEP